MHALPHQQAHAAMWLTWLPSSAASIWAQIFSIWRKDQTTRLIVGQEKERKGKRLGRSVNRASSVVRGDFTSFGKQRDTYGRDCAPGDSTGEQLLYTVSQIRDNSASKGWMWARCTKWLQRYLRYRDGNLSPGLKCRWGSAERAATQISWSWEKATLKGNETKLKEIGWDSIKPE